MPDRLKVHNVILAVSQREGELVQKRNPHMRNWSIITRERELVGLNIGEWVITETAARGMRDYDGMVRYLTRAEARTRALSKSV
ncbi:hypothetical protein QLQ77_gp62 [Gordonia phage Reyja]|uniref:Uncharacterized protein n=1 Tax=Gordonia phage Reyja TaxID=2571250 RepID=A0A4D6TAJ9_9CAUD|nr:hypothetical protein QLQ77_gp62 [Gordonia phage Reyja]QCG77807.1 hypothetical protein SEA_REYJA_62 [Gordonia phage Reyja]